jgi:isocitrate/isopropylmalate dehydrogenase
MSRSRNIAVVPGDGIGPQVIDAGMRILEQIIDSYS